MHRMWRAENNRRSRCSVTHSGTTGEGEGWRIRGRLREGADEDGIYGFVDGALDV